MNSCVSLAWRVALALLATSVLALVFAGANADPDLWGHLRFGLDILRDGIPETDTYSYLTEGQRWINHEWLAEVLFGAAWTLGGPAGLVALKFGIALLTVGALAWHLSRAQLHPLRIALIVALLGLPLLAPFFTVRPQIFTCLLFTVLVIVLRRAEDGHYRILWLTPPLMALWVNLHGGFLAGLGLLGLWTLARLATDWPARWRLALPALAAGLATLANPYGVDLLLFLLHTATVPRPEIQDWKPLALASVHGLIYVVLFGVTAAGLQLSREPRRLAPLLLLALTALLPWLAVRHIVLFGITAIVFAGEHVASAWDRLFSGRGDEVAQPLSPAGAAIPAVGALALIALCASIGLFTQVRVRDSEQWPAAPVALLAQAGVSGKLMTEYGWGEYVIWHLGPGVQVGMDGRRETVYPPEAYEQWLHFDDGVKDWDSILKRHPPDAALLQKDKPAANLLKLSDGWALVYEDALAKLYVRKASPWLEPLVRTARTFNRPPLPDTFP